jgi:glycosyltransferase involved in cell wall biosynthesis
MKVLYISYDGMTDSLGRSQVIPYLAGLTTRGYEIHLISFEKKHIARQDTEAVASLLKSHRIHWHPLQFLTYPPLFSKAADVLKIHYYAQKLHRKEHFDIVHCRSYIAALAGLKLKSLYKVKFVFDMRGFWANERIEGGIWNMKNPVYRFFYFYFKKKERKFFQYADAVVSLTHNGKSEIKRMFGSEVASKTHVIPCCVDTQLFDKSALDPDVALALRHDLGLNGSTFVLSYLGSVGTWYMTEQMLDFFSILKTKYKTARFLFISPDDPLHLETMAVKAGLQPKDIAVVKSPRHMVPYYLSMSHMSVFFIKPVFSKKASSPTKQAEIMSMGIPLVCNAGIGDTDLLMQDKTAGIMLRDFSPQEMQRAVDAIQNSLKTDPALIREKALKFFNLDDGVEAYHQIYKKVMG